MTRRQTLGITPPVYPMVSSAHVRGAMAIQPIHMFSTHKTQA